MRKKLAIGIDLGTTNSAVGVWYNERVELLENSVGTRLTPSYAYYSPDGDCVGTMAVDKSSTDPKNVFFDAKRLLAETIDSPKVQEFTETWPFKVVGHPEPGTGKAHFLSVYEGKGTPISPEKVSSDVLKSLLSDVHKRFRPQDYNIEAVITVPAYFNTEQKRATMEAARAAGINAKEILSEPVAAAIAYHLELAGEKKLKDGDSVFIFDLGGGTFDVTIMKIENGEYKVIALGGDSHLGGRDFDRVIADIMEERLRKQLGDDNVNELMAQPKYRYRLIQAAHEAKESFTQTDNETLSLSDIHPDTKDEDLPRRDFEERSQYLQDRIKKCCEDTLKDGKIDPEDINHVLLVGGASRMNMIANILKNIFLPETNLSKAISGDEAIAIGATIYAARLLGVSESSSIKNLKIQDALPLSIGIASESNKFTVILERNFLFPVQNNITWKTTEDNQTHAVIPIYEGISENIDENIRIGDIKIEGIPPEAAEEMTITIFLKVDKNGLIESKAQIQGTDKDLDTKIIYIMKFGNDRIVSKVIDKGGKKYAVGIDLGTTNSVIGIWHLERVEIVKNKEGGNLTPSYAYYVLNPSNKLSEDSLILNSVGKVAFSKSSTDPQNVFFDAKRLLAQTIDSQNVQNFLKTWPFKVIGYPNQENGKAHFVNIHGQVQTRIPPEKVSTDILESLLNNACHRLRTTKEYIEAVITVPAYFNTQQKTATMEAAKAAGINVKQLLSEPAAAALSYKWKMEKKNKFKEGDYIFIFDLGGGTFDATIIKIENGIYKVIALGGDTHLGGRDFDRVIADIMEERLRKQLGDDKVNKLMAQPKTKYRLNEMAQKAKEILTAEENMILDLERIHLNAKNEELTRKKFEEKSQHLQDEIKKHCKKVLQDAKISPKDINHIIRVGGASQMNMVDNILHNIFSQAIILKTVKGNEAVVVGATVYAARLLNVTENQEIQDISDKNDSLSNEAQLEESISRLTL